MTAQVTKGLAAVAAAAVLTCVVPSARAQFTYPSGYDPQSGQSWERDIRYDPVLNPFGMRDWQYSQLFNTGQAWYAAPMYGFIRPAGYAYGAYSQQPSAQDNRAHIRLIVPPDAKVWFGNSLTQQTGAVRNFDSPPLTAGKDYSYDIKVQWRDASGKELTRTRQVGVRANSQTTVELARPGSGE